MSLKDIWQDRQNEIDDIDANDINSVAHAVIELEEDNQKKTEEIVSLSEDLVVVKNEIFGIEEELQMINEGGIE